MRRLTISAVIFLSLVVLSTARVGASDPMGVYAVIEKVVMEPGDTAPERIQIWGAFAVSDGQRGDGYGTPQRGYVYYSCPKGQERTCRNEWTDLASVAGKGIGVGFGGRYVPTGRIRRADEKPANPDTFPIKMGVQRMGSEHDQPAIVSQLKAALAVR
jgi:hypothetical protein